MLKFLVNAVAAMTVIFLVGPLFVVVAASFTTTNYIAFPPVGFTLDWYKGVLMRGDLVASFFVSLQVAVLVSVLATALGTIAALGLSQSNAIGRDFLRALIVSPLVLPTVVTGVALYTFSMKYEMHSTYLTLVAGHSLITIPYVVRTVGAALVELDTALPEAAECLGASWFRRLREVIAPAILPAIMVSLLMSFIVSFDQVTISIFLVSPDVSTLPVKLYNYVLFSLDPMVAAASALMIVFAYALVLVVERAFGLDRLFKNS